MGRRRLHRAILAPSTDRAIIEEHLDAVATLVHEELLQQELQGLLKEVHDLERLIGKLGTRRMRPLDLLLLQKTLEKIPAITTKLAEVQELSSLLTEIRSVLGKEEVSPLCASLSGMLIEQPPIDARDGGLIRKGYDDELDRLRDEVRALRSQIASLEEREREKTSKSATTVSLATTSR
jgi:DNA mismatch repair protein MutS